MHQIEFSNRIDDIKWLKDQLTKELTKDFDDLQNEIQNKNWLKNALESKDKKTIINAAKRILNTCLNDIQKIWFQKTINKRWASYVLALQVILYEVGLKPWPIDGIRWKQTKEAVEKRQEQNNLWVDGAAWKETIQSLLASISSKEEYHQNIEFSSYRLQIDKDYTITDWQLNLIAPKQVLYNIKSLTLSTHEIGDISELTKVPDLLYLDLQNNNISDISSLTHLTKLIAVNLNENNISDITPLKNFTQLTHLFLGNNKIWDLSPLQSIRTLQKLWLHWDQITHLKEFNTIHYIQHIQHLEITDFIYNEANKENLLTVLKELQNLTTLTLKINDNGNNNIINEKKAWENTIKDFKSEISEMNNNVNIDMQVVSK